MNHLYFGDNLDVLRKHVDDESVDLIYLDPPFNSKASYNILYTSPIGADAQRMAFEDTWRWEDGAEEALEGVRHRDLRVFRMLRAMQDFLGQSDLMAYLAMMSVRLIELHRVLRSTGSLYLHCDPTASHYLKLVLDAIFGASNFRNEIVWQRNTGKALMTRRLPSSHDTILVYGGSESTTWNQGEIFIKYDPSDLPEKTKVKYCHKDADGRIYRLDSLINPNRNRPNLTYEFLGVTRVWRWTQNRMHRAYDEGLVVQSRPGTVPQLKRYLDEQRGLPLGDVWTDIPPLNSQARERLGYPTQKPLALLDRIVSSSSNVGDVVLDPFCGCGTAVHSAEQLGRRWIGIDITYLAVQVIEDRLSTWLPNARYSVEGLPKDEFTARQLAKRDPYLFQDWAVSRVGGQARGRGPDKGIDGEIAFLMGGPQKYGHGIVSVKAGRHVGPDAVRVLKSVVAREGADMGVFICVNEPTQDMRTEAATGGRIELPGGSRPRIQIVTAKDLIAGPNLGILTELNAVQVAQEAKSVKRKRKPIVPTPEDLRREPPLPPMPIAGGKQSGRQRQLPIEEPLLVPQQERKRERRKH